MHIWNTGIFVGGASCYTCQCFSLLVLVVRICTKKLLNFVFRYLLYLIVCFVLSVLV